MDTSIGSVDFNSDTIYLGVKVESDAEMTPRIRFTAVPYAFNAEKVSGLTVTNTTGTFTLANSKTLTVNNTLTFSGTDGTTFTFPSGTGTVVTLDSTGALSNKTLTEPRFVDGGFIADSNGAEMLIFDSNASAVNELTISNGATGVGPTIIATGETNVPLTINSKAAGAITLDSGTTGAVNIGVGNNAKTISIGTGTAGNIVNIGTNNSVSDTITIGSALDNVAITGDSWSITDAGALTVTSCSGCGGGSQTPWTSDIDADGFDLRDLSNLEFQSTTGAPAGTVVGIYSDNTGDLNLNALSAKSINFQIAGSDEYNFSSSTLGLNGNSLTSVGGIELSANQTINPGSSGTLGIGTANTTVLNLGVGTATTNVIGGNIVLTGNTSVSSGNTFTVSSGEAVVTGQSGGSATTLRVNNHTSTGSIFVAQDAATDIFTVGDGGNVTLNQFITDANAVLYASTTGVITRVTETETGSQCLLSGAGASGVPTWGSCGGGAQTPWTSNIDADNFSLLDLGANITSRAGLTIGTASDGNLTLTPAGTGDTIITGDADSNLQLNFGAAPAVDMHVISNSGFGTTTDGVDGLYINFVQADDAGVDSNYGLNIGLTAASDDAGEVLGAINLTVTGQTANNRERGITIGSGFDEDIYFASASAQIRMQDGGEIEFTDGSYGGAQHNDLPLARVKEYFTAANYGVVESTGFINIDGSFRMDQFVRSTLNITADAIGSAQRLGDYQDWSLDEAGTGAGGTNTQQVGCVARTGGDTNFASASRVNGAMEIRLDTTTVTNAGNNWCMVQHAAGNGSTATNNGILQVANKFIVYYKVRLGSNVTNSASYKYVYLGVNNLTGGTTGRPANNSGIWFSNTPGNQTNTGTNYTAGTTWLGNVNNGTNATNHSTVGCSGANLSINTATSAWALMRIEARATNDVRFFMDTDVSDGVALGECGSVTNNIPTNPMKPNIMLSQSGTSNSTWALIVDLFAFVQDDPRDGSGGADGLESSQEEFVPSAPDPIYGADLAENYVIDGEFDIGDIVSLGDSPGIAKRSDRPHDRKVLGVISESPGLMIGEASYGFTTAPIALTGRVPVKVSSKNGKIKIGDPITSSDIPGVGVRAITPGKIIGTAMEDFSGDTGKIMVAINVGYYIGDEADTSLIEQPEESVLSESLGTDVLAEATQSAGLSGISTGSALLKEPENANKNDFSIQDTLEIGANFVLQGASIHVMGEDLKLQPLRQGGVNILDGLVVFTTDGITFAGNTIFETEVLFKGIATFASDVVFQSVVRFDKAPVFGRDTAGYATIQKGQRFVDVVFDTEYKDPPVVNISIQIQKLDESRLAELKQSGLCTPDAAITMCEEKIASEILNDNFRFAVSSKNTQGFMIVLNKEAPVDITFSWQALAVRSPVSAKNDAYLPQASSNEDAQGKKESEVLGTEHEKEETEIKREINVIQADKILSDPSSSLIEDSYSDEVSISSQSGVLE
ncbi:MAG: hypothetical protein KA035_00810 [Candidatus Levybacteria bacterium]|nr:hypothetical protein [Candidatus Levybacteria bacterium]